METNTQVVKGYSIPRHMSLGILIILRPEQNGYHFADDIPEAISWEHISIPLDDQTISSHGVDYVCPVFPKEGFQLSVPSQHIQCKPFIARFIIANIL